MGGLRNGDKLRKCFFIPKRLIFCFDAAPIDTVKVWIVKVVVDGLPNLLKSAELRLACTR